MKPLALFIIVIAIHSLGYTQSQSFHMYNTDNYFLYNPSILSPDQKLNATGYYSKDFGGIENAPSKMFLSFQSPIPYQNLAVGLAIEKATLGVFDDLGVHIAGTYKLKTIFSKNDFLSIGIGTKIHQIFLNYDKISVQDISDPYYSNTNEKSLNVNANIGISYRNRKEVDFRKRIPIFEIGVGVSRIIPQNIEYTTIKLEEELVINAIGTLSFPVYNDLITYGNLYSMVNKNANSYFNIIGGIEFKNLLILGIGFDSYMNLGFEVGVKYTNNRNNGFYELKVHSNLGNSHFGTNLNSGFGATFQYNFEIE